jgi:cell division protein FtsB
MSEPPVYIVTTNEELEKKISPILTPYSMIYEFVSSPTELIDKIKRYGASLIFVDEKVTENVPLFCEQIRLFSKNCHISLILGSENSRNRNFDKTGAQSCLFVNSSDEVFREVIDEYVGVSEKLEALRAISLDHKKRKIIGEISNFNNYVKELSELRKKNKKLEDEIEDLKIANERLAAEMREKHKILVQLEEGYKKLKDENQKLVDEIDELKVQKKIGDEKVAESIEYFDFIDERLRKTIERFDEIAAQTGKIPIEQYLKKIEELERENRLSSKVFDEILQTLTQFVSGESLSVEDTFEKIIESLAKFTSI